MADWKIHTKEERCAECERVFEEGEAMFSVLRFSGEGLFREDHCDACFRARREEDGAEDLIWWRTRRRAEVRRGLAVDFEAVQGLFIALEGREEEPLQELRYLLCLLLMRKRRLKLVRVRRSAAGEAMLVRRPRTRKELEVFVFDLTPERAGALREQLEGLFEGAAIEDVLARATRTPEEGVGEGPESPAAPPPSEAPTGSDAPASGPPRK